MDYFLISALRSAMSQHLVHRRGASAARPFARPRKDPTLERYGDIAFSRVADSGKSCSTRTASSRAKLFSKKLSHLCIVMARQYCTDTVTADLASVWRDLAA
jgi:hypothetical protein